MPQIMIPPLGSVILLEQDWSFRLFDEHRNETIQRAANLFPPFRQSLSRYLHQDVSKNWGDMKHSERAAEIDKTDWVYHHPNGMSVSSPYNYWSGDWDHEFTFREGTELKVDRIYIRRGLKGFDSVTFRTNNWVSAIGDPLFTASRKVKTLRFWAKLDDVNRIVGRYV